MSNQSRPFKEISYSQSPLPSVTLPEGEWLADHLDVRNSPILFGCRTGICGTCLIEIEAVSDGHLADPLPDELEVLDIVAPANPRARLACQLQLTASLKVNYLG